MSANLIETFPTCRKTPWRLSSPQKARQRKRLRAVDRVVDTLSAALARNGQSTKAVERWYAEMPREEEMLPKDKYTLFDKKEKSYRKSIHSMLGSEKGRVMQRQILTGFSFCRAAQVDSCQPACEPSWFLKKSTSSPAEHLHWTHPLRLAITDHSSRSLYYIPYARPLYSHSIVGLGANNIGRIPGVFHDCENAAALEEDGLNYTCFITQRLDQFRKIQYPFRKSCYSGLISRDRTNDRGGKNIGKIGSQMLPLPQNDNIRAAVLADTGHRILRHC